MKAWQMISAEILAEINLGRLIRETAKELRSELKKAKAAFVETLGKRVSQATPTEIFAELRKVKVGGSFRKRGVTPLPAWAMSDGTIEETPEQRAEVWRERCSDLEAGFESSIEIMQAKAAERQRIRIQQTPAPSFDELPSVTQIENRLRKIKMNKAGGNDSFRSELCHLAAVPLSKHLHAIAVKFSTHLLEPIQFRGGTLVSAYKNSGRKEEVTSYRSLLLSAHMGKAVRGWLRDSIMPLYQAQSADTHFACKRGGNVSHASMLLRAFMRGAAKRLKSTSAIFVDVASAFYRVVRELVVNLSSSDEEIIEVLRRFRLGPEHFALLREQLARPSILTQDGSPRQAAVLDALMHDTWLSVPNNHQLTATCAGSRPGDTFADVVFSLIYSQMLSVFRRTMREEGLKTVDDLAFHPGFRSISIQEVQASQAATLIDLTWADDLAVAQCHEDPRTLLANTQLAAGLIQDLCARRGLELNYKKGKSECLLKLCGPKSKQLKLQLFADKEPHLPIPSTTQKDLKLRLTHQYKHLGSQLHFGLKQMQELKSRIGQAKSI